VPFPAVALPSSGCSRGNWMDVIFPPHPDYSCSCLVLSPLFPSRGDLYGRDRHLTIRNGKWGGGGVWLFTVGAVVPEMLAVVAFR
jgi:hypothetical protein